jgi:hypothetical protein
MKRLREDRAILGISSARSGSGAHALEIDMFRKILICTVLASPLVTGPALASDYDGYGYRSPRYAGHRPVVLRGYYGHSYAHFHPYGPHHYALAAAAWHSYTTGYRTGEPAYAPDPQTYSMSTALDYTQPIVAYRNATAYVPVTTYRPVPIRVYYVPQHEPYYNVPPYAVQGECFCR